MSTLLSKQIKNDNLQRSAAEKAIAIIVKLLYEKKHPKLKNDPIKSIKYLMMLA